MIQKEAHWNEKVAKNRGSKWKKNLLSGRLAIQTNPTEIRINRIKRNLTQVDLAKRLNITCTTYSAVEAGRRTIQRSTAEKLCKILSLDLENVFSSTKSKSGRLLANHRASGLRP